MVLFISISSHPCPPNLIRTFQMHLMPRVASVVRLRREGHCWNPKCIVQSDRMSGFWFFSARRLPARRKPNLYLARGKQLNTLHWELFKLALDQHRRLLPMPFHQITYALFGLCSKTSTPDLRLCGCTGHARQAPGLIQSSLTSANQNDEHKHDRLRRRSDTEIDLSALSLLGLKRPTH